MTCAIHQYTCKRDSPYKCSVGACSVCYALSQLLHYYRVSTFSSLIPFRLFGENGRSNLQKYEEHDEKVRVAHDAK